VVKKGGLGKGLESLMGEADAEIGVMNPDSSIPLARIKPNKSQPRKNFDASELAELTDSIKKNGVLQPLLVRKSGSTYEIVAGERRYQAAKAAGLQEVPVIVRDVSDDEIFKLALIENLQRADLNPIEEAQGYKKLIENDALTQEQLAELVSKSRSAITNKLRLLDLPAEVQNLMSDGRLTAGHARAILAVPSDEGRIKLAEKVIAENLSVRQTESLAPLFSGSGTESTKREPLPQSFKRAARQLRIALDTNVKVKKVRGKNKIEIEFASDEELSKIVDLLSGEE
jgi:ParB family chromosome partitioning protein